MNDHYDIDEYPEQNGKWGGYRVSSKQSVGGFRKLATLQLANIDTKFGGVDQNKSVSDIVKYPESKSNNGIPH